MKKTILIFLAAAVLTSCKKDDDKKNPGQENYTCATCVTASEAKAEHDHSSAGVYKGVMVGSTGTIALYLYNAGTEVKALVVFDGKNGELSTSDLASWTPGQAISNALFTGTVNNTLVQAVFSVDANGLNPRVNVAIPGHTVVVALYKETSASMIKNYEGTYTGDRSGIFNISFNADDFVLVTNGGSEPITGTLVNGKIDLNKDGVTIKGEFSGEQISGTWADGNGRKGTWTGKRTL